MTVAKNGCTSGASAGSVFVNRRSIHGPPYSSGGRLIPCTRISSGSVAPGRSSRFGESTWRAGCISPVPGSTEIVIVVTMRHDASPMRMNRIFCEGPLQSGAEIPLAPAGAYHVARVLRMREGAPLAVFDGSGQEFRAEIVRVAGDDVTVRVNEPSPVTPESPLRI